MSYGTNYELPQFFREKVQQTFSAPVRQNDQLLRSAGIIDPEWTTDRFDFWERAPRNLKETTGQRGGKTPRSEFKASKRSGTKRQFSDAVQFDVNDTARLEKAMLPDNEVSQDFMSAWNTQVDIVKIQAAGAPALTVKEGTNETVAVALPASMTIPVGFQRLPSDAAGANTGFTIFKLVEAKRQMKDAKVPLSGKRLILAISPQMEQSWIVYAQAAQNDAWAKVLGLWVQDPTQKVLGCEVVVTTELQSPSAGIDEALLFTDDAFKMSDASIITKYSELPDDNYAHQIWFQGRVGCVRYKDEYVKRILSDRSGVMLAGLPA